MSGFGAAGYSDVSGARRGWRAGCSASGTGPGAPVALGLLRRSSAPSRWGGGGPGERAFDGQPAGHGTAPPRP